MHNITIVSVCYESSGVLPSMLGALPADVPTILIDNASDDVALTRRIAADHSARLVELPTNVGFGTACNLAAENATTEFLLFLNPDCVPDPDALAKLSASAEAYPGAVAFNPAILDADGRLRFKRGSVLLPRRRWMRGGAPDSDMVIPVLHGAALFVRRAAFEQVGGFDPAIFLYHEDDDLALRLAELGDLMFVRDARVRHEGGASSPRTPSIAALKAWHMGRSRVYAARKHGRAFPFAWPLFQAVLSVCAAPPFSARKRAKRTAFLRGVISMRSYS